MTGVTIDEGRRVPGPEADWAEGHRVSMFDPASGVGITFEVSVHPSEATARFVAAVLRPDDRAVVLVDDDVPFPSRGWEIRTSGLWADHNCETPNEHWSYGLEAFALAIDQPDQLLQSSFGDRVPLGWELEFESTDLPDGLADGYVQTGVVHGLLLGQHPPFEVEGPAIRRHWWGRSDGASWQAIDCLGDPTGHSVQRAFVPTSAGVRAVDLTGTGLRVTSNPQTAVL